MGFGFRVQGGFRDLGNWGLWLRGFFMVLGLGSRGSIDKQSDRKHLSPLPNTRVEGLGIRDYSTLPTLLGIRDCSPLPTLKFRV